MKMPMNPQPHPNAFKRGFLAVASGTALAHIITLLVAPVLSRLFTPEAYGVLGMFTTVAALLGAIACLRLDAAIVAASPEERTSVAITAVLTLSVFATIVAFACTMVALHAPFQFSFTYLPAIAALPITASAIGVYSALAQLLAVNGLFTPISISSVLRAAGGHAAQLLSTIGAQAAGGLIWGNTAGHLAALIHVLGAGRRHFPTLLGTRIRFSAAKRVLRQHRDFIVFGTPQVFFGIVNYSFPILVLAIGFDAAVVGSYAMAQRILTMPTGVITNSLRQVLYPRMADAIQAGTLRRLATKLMKLLLPTIVIGGATAYFAAPWIVPWALGAEWELAGTLCSALVFWVAGSAISLPAVSAIPLVGLQRFHSRFEGVLFAIRFTLTLLGVYSGNLTVAVLGPSLASLLFNIGLTSWAFFSSSGVFSLNRTAGYKTS